MVTYPGMKRKTKKPASQPYISSASPYHPTSSTHHTHPLSRPPQSYNPSAHTPSYQPHANPPVYHHPAPPSYNNNPPPTAPPPLTNLPHWFDYYDRDRSGTLDKEELVNALIQTTGASGDTDVRSIRDTAYNVFDVFDMNKSRGIDKREFCQPGGLGESLLATFKQSGGGSGGSGNSGHWKCHTCDFPNYPGKNLCAMCGVTRPTAAVTPSPITPYNPYTTTPSSSSQMPPAMNPHHTPPPVPPISSQSPRRHRTVRAPIPPNARPGQTIQVRIDLSGPVVKTTIPERSQWVYPPNNAPAYFEFRAEVAEASSTPTPHIHAPQAHTPLAPPPPVASGAEWVPYTHFRAGPYEPPPQQIIPVSIPPSLPVFRASGRRRSLLIGINYTGTRAQLKGCVNDAKQIKNLLLRHGYPDDGSHMVMLTDESNYNGGHYLPTAANITRAMKWLVQGVSAGDVLFFHFSGHGAQVPDQTGQEADGLNETILPLDYKSRQITDDELWGTLVYPLPEGVRMTCIMDCCHSGTGLDLPYEYDYKAASNSSTPPKHFPWSHSHKSSVAQSEGRKVGPWAEDINPAQSLGDVVLFSGCKDDQTSADVQSSRVAGGAMTNSFLKAYEKNNMPTYPEFLNQIHKYLKKGGYSQRPQLTSSQPFEVERRVFSLVDGIEPNRNECVGRLKRKHIKPGKGNGGGVHDIDEFLFGGGVAQLGMALAGAAVISSLFD